MQDKRLPLLDVSAGRANVSPCKSRLLSKGDYEKHGNWESNVAGPLEDAEDLEFGSDIMFTSTPFTPKPMKAMEEPSIYGDTTVDE